MDEATFYKTMLKGFISYERDVMEKDSEQSFDDFVIEMMTIGAMALIGEKK